ncbi:MAG: TonB-dependent receptor, partial [Planctomycetota bacterium]|nr:TonB-dependent receptor [Planctomycetota bacterium]
TRVERRGDGYRDQGEWHQNDSNVKVRVEIDEDSWVAFSASYMEDFHKAPGGLTMAEFAADRFGNGRPENSFAGHRTVGDALYHRELSDNAWVEGFVQAAGTKRHLRGERPRFGDPTSISNWEDDAYFWAVGGRGQAEFQNHRLYGGVRVHREWISDWTIFSEAFPADGSTPSPVLASSFYLTTFSAHIDDTFEVTDRLTVVFGARIEWVPSAKGNDSVSGFVFDSDFFTVLPGVGASFEATDRVVIFANYHEGFRAPQVFGFGSARPGDGLDFEESTLIEGGLRFRRVRGLAGSVTVWRTDYDNFHLFTSDGFFENLGRILATGVDLEFEWAAGDVWESLEGFSILASLTVQDAELRSGVNRGNDVPYAWDNKAAWRLRYERDGWVASIGGTFVGDSFSDDANTAASSADGQIGMNPSRTIWDLQVYRKMTFGENENVTLEIFGGFTNLFDKDWFVHSRGGFFGGGMVAGQPRNGYIAFQLTTVW